MSWAQRYRIWHYLKYSVWVPPLLGIVLALACHRLAWLIGDRTRWVLFNYSKDSAQALVGALTASFLTFMVFLLSMLLIVVQLAASQLTPRIIASAFRNRATRTALGIFVFTYVFCLATLGRIETRVPQLPVLITVVLSVFTLVVFIYLVELTGMALRPVAVAALAATQGQSVLERLHTVPFKGADGEAAEAALRGRSPTRTIYHTGPPNYLVAFETTGLIEAARQVDCLVRLMPEVGEFVDVGAPLFQVYGEGEIAAGELQQWLAFGSERTLEQDATFAFRIMVDIAIRALSPAVNDPTTAVVILNQIQRLLHVAGLRELGPGAGLDGEGRVRLVYPRPRWQDYVWLGVSEIRLYGAGSMQVLRRLRALLEELIAVLPEARAPALREQLALVERAAERGFVDPEDRRAAGLADEKGIGGEARAA